MKNVSNGEIYEFFGIYHLVLEEATNGSRKMFWCSLDHEKNMVNLLQGDNYGIVTPREEWQYVGKIADSDYKKALTNFRANLEEQYNLENKNSQKISR